MATLVTPLPAQCIDFEVDYHKTMAAVLATCKVVRNHAWTLRIAKDFWSVCRDFKALLTQLDQSHNLSPADIYAILPKLQNLHSTSNRLIDTATKAGLQNRALTGASVATFVRNNNQLCDIIERFKLSLDPAVAAAVRDAIGEYERGETVSLDSLV
jgi:hypothetical protein